MPTRVATPPEGLRRLAGSATRWVSHCWCWGIGAALLALLGPLGAGALDYHVSASHSSAFSVVVVVVVVPGGVRPRYPGK